MSISSDKDPVSKNDINLFSTKEEEQQLEKLIKNIFQAVAYFDFHFISSLYLIATITVRLCRKH